MFVFLHFGDGHVWCLPYKISDACNVGNPYYLWKRLVVWRVRLFCTPFSSRYNKTGACERASVHCWRHLPPTVPIPWSATSQTTRSTVHIGYAHIARWTWCRKAHLHSFGTMKLNHRRGRLCGKCKDACHSGFSSFYFKCKHRLDMIKY